MLVSAREGMAGMNCSKHTIYCKHPECPECQSVADNGSGRALDICSKGDDGCEESSISEYPLLPIIEEEPDMPEPAPRLDRTPEPQPAVRSSQPQTPVRDPQPVEGNAFDFGPVQDEFFKHHPLEASQLVPMIRALLNETSRATDWTNKNRLSELLPNGPRGKPIHIRIIAAAAKLAGGEIISTGNGMKLSDHGTDKEIATAYWQGIRRSDGEKARANAVLAWAKSNGRTLEAGFKKTFTEVQRELEIGELTIDDD
jgi:hypothetical protein